MSTKDGGSAFPIPPNMEYGIKAHPGASLLDYFAAAALMGFMANPQSAAAMHSIASDRPDIGLLPLSATPQPERQKATPGSAVTLCGCSLYGGRKIRCAEHERRSGVDRRQGFASRRCRLVAVLKNRRKNAGRRSGISRRKFTTTEGGDRHDGAKAAPSHVAPGASAMQEAGAPEAYKWPQVTMEYCDDESGRYWVSHLVGTSILSDGETREEAFAHLLEAIVDTVQALCEWSAPTLTPAEAERLAEMAERQRLALNIRAEELAEDGYGASVSVYRDEAADWRRIEEIVRAAGRRG